MGGYIIIISQVECQCSRVLEVVLHLNLNKSHGSSFNVQCQSTLYISVNLKS